MKESQRSLRHLAFFEELAHLDEVSSAWREFSAGLVVLRLVDAWIEDGTHVVQSDAWGMTGVRAAISDIPHGRPVRGILGSIVDAMQASSTIDVHAITPRLIAYGRALDFDAKWALAADVYRTVAAHADPQEDAESATAAHQRLGYCLRQIGDLENALEAYGTAGQLADAANDIVGVLLARIGGAKVAIMRGNLPQAESVLDATISDAARLGLTNVQSIALHDRSYTAGLRGDYELAIQLAYRALESPSTEHDRDRILHDIATSFYNLGVRTAARDAYLVLAATAQEQYLRWQSTIQLLAIAADDQMGPAFERYRRELAEADLPPSVAVDFWHQAGRGYRLFRKRDVAADLLGRAVKTAQQFNLNQEVFLIEAELERLNRDEIAEGHRESEPSPAQVRDVADALQILRERVLAKT